jgi:hypothetical protein
VTLTPWGGFLGNHIKHPNDIRSAYRLHDQQRWQSSYHSSAALLLETCSACSFVKSGNEDVEKLHATVITRMKGYHTKWWEHVGRMEE